VVRSYQGWSGVIKG